MANFEQAVALVLKHEGGFVDDPDDKGGMTNFGITEGAFLSFYKRTPSHEEMINLTVQQAKEIYKSSYWNPFHFDSEPNQKFATVAFNMAVLRGPVSISKFLLSKSALEIIIDSQIKFIIIARNNPTQIKFLLGWINRTHELLRYLYEG